MSDIKYSFAQKLEILIATSRSIDRQRNLEREQDPEFKALQQLRADLDSIRTESTPTPTAEGGLR